MNLFNRKKRYLSFQLSLAFLFPVFVFAQSINPTTHGKGLQFIAADSSFSTKLNVRAQSLFSSTYDLDEKTYSDNLQIRRARIKMEGFIYSPKIEYKFEFALSNSDTGRPLAENNNTSNIVLDAIVNWNFAKGFNLIFGQTKLPGNRERVVSSQRLQLVDRSLLNSRYNIDRDFGVQLHHESQSGDVVIKEMLSISSGEGRNMTSDNEGGYDYTGRVEVLPFGEFQSGGDYFGGDLKREVTPKLSLGLTYDFNDRASRQGGQLGSFFDQQRDLKTIFADVMLKYKGFSTMAEYANKKTNGSPVVEVDPSGDVTKAFFTGTGFNIQAGYLFKNNVELAGRFTQINPEAVTQRDKNTQYTLGISKYISGHTLKVQSDISLLQENSDAHELMYRFQVEIGF
jgi:phosphate-selective porin OprO and OprP